MASSLKKFDVRFVRDQVYLIRRVRARDADEACARVRHQVARSHSHRAEEAK